jgi:hypothetical protein
LGHARQQVSAEHQPGLQQQSATSNKHQASDSDTDGVGAQAVDDRQVEQF